MKVKKILAALLVASIPQQLWQDVAFLKVIVQVQEEAQLQVAQIPSHLLMSL